MFTSVSNGLNRVGNLAGGSSTFSWSSQCVIPEERAEFSPLLSIFEKNPVFPPKSDPSKWRCCGCRGWGNPLDKVTNQGKKEEQSYGGHYVAILELVDDMRWLGSKDQLCSDRTSCCACCLFQPPPTSLVLEQDYMDPSPGSSALVWFQRQGAGLFYLKYVFPVCLELILLKA